MGVLEQLSTWFSNLSTVSYLAGNAGLSKKLGYRFGALLSAIDKLPGLSPSDPSGVYTEGSSSRPDVMESAPDIPSIPPRPSVPSRDQDSVMATPCPSKQRTFGCLWKCSSSPRPSYSFLCPGQACWGTLFPSSGPAFICTGRFYPFSCLRTTTLKGQVPCTSYKGFFLSLCQ